MEKYRRICAFIDLDAVEYNFEQMRQALTPGIQMIAVVKADAYGHGAVPIAALMEPKEYIWGFAVATIEEAVQLRKAGIEKPVLVLGFVFPDGYEDAVRYDIRLAVFKLTMAKQLSEEALRQGKTAYLHIKVDTGMGRIGFPDDETSADIVKEISLLPGVQIEGLFTHFARADERDKEAARRQLDRYLRFSRMLEERKIEIPLHHCSNTAGIFDSLL